MGRIRLITVLMLTHVIQRSANDATSALIGSFLIADRTADAIVVS